ncbi:hypothetical protein UFOVP703_28 [uncultured Caudovirales phage]|uniref:Uncharacterized protein n=1 Tax=uncultured Caudovirales phage TaxID=2100421 RepID=A0A6J5NMU9_9CAUD|nr:hypothetical protein UFOVP703_28 [uncultured Caudovirales phage]
MNTPPGWTPPNLDDDETAARIGRNLAFLLKLQRIKHGPHAGRYDLVGGTKTPAGLARTVARYLADLEG